MTNQPHIDQTLPVQERIASFLRATDNPYQMQINGMSVEMRYCNGAPTLQEKMTRICQQ
ncbi:hypothetical protein RFF05_04705 [Bengtsoniella intestinalis]|uniref:DUF6870 family protein n=1 Tax=Bengtsoniella intestinalis TaxID=3073143 RepID=UPI00391F15F6